MRSVPVAVPGLVVVDHELSVPLDPFGGRGHGDLAGERITVFAREVADPDGRDRPFLVFLQGGPGQEAPRPTRLPTSPGWLDRALEDYRVLLVDQRGTGRSSPVGSLTGLAPA
jgi:pimeloyl-ACP methyl ester carboxylesterase